MQGIGRTATHSSAHAKRAPAAFRRPCRIVRCFPLYKKFHPPFLRILSNKVSLAQEKRYCQHNTNDFHCLAFHFATPAHALPRKMPPTHARRNAASTKNKMDDPPSAIQKKANIFLGNTY
jgi:hypothetical protein